MRLIQGELGATELGDTDLPTLFKSLGFFSLNFIHQDRDKNNFKLYDTSVVNMCPHTSQRPVDVCCRMLSYADVCGRVLTTLG